jgi:hypothetical protein
MVFTDALPRQVKGEARPFPHTYEKHNMYKAGAGDGEILNSVAAVH